MKKNTNFSTMNYEDVNGWRQINDCTIREAENSSGSQHLQTKVPQGIHFELSEIEVVDGYKWSSEFATDGLLGDELTGKSNQEKSEKRTSEYIRKGHINAKANTDDEIIVFSLKNGVLAKFKEIKEVSIYPIEPNIIGGKNKANTMDGIRYSGWSAQEVPNDGLMEGEPGRLMYLTKSYDVEDEYDEPYLSLTLYLDEAKFDQMFTTLLSNITYVDQILMTVAIELFENEMQAALNEPWMTSEYGLLVTSEDEDIASTKARIDGISITYAKPRAMLQKTEENLSEKKKSFWS